jgi:PAS domain S-box-containing protein
MNHHKKTQGELIVELESLYRRPATLEPTDAKRNEIDEKLEENSELCRKIFSDANDAVFLIDPSEDKIIDVNSKSCEMLEYSRDSLLATKISEIHPQEMDKMHAFSQSVLKQRYGWTDELTCRTRSGTFLPTEISASTINIDGRPCLLVLVRDISQRKQAEAALRASENRYRALFEDSPVSLWEEDYSAIKTYLERLRNSGTADFRSYFENHPEAARDCAAMAKVVDVNKQTLALLQADSKEELLGSLARIFHDESYHVFREQLICLADGKAEFEADTINRTRRGNEIYVSLKMSIAPNYEETWSKVFISLTDITKRKQAEEQQKTMVSDLRAIVEAADELTACTNVDSLFRRAVELARDKLGMERCAIFVRDNGNVRGTYGTDQFGHTTNEQACVRPMDEVWKQRFRLLRPGDPRWFAVDEAHTARDHGKNIQIGEGWVAITPIQTSGRPIIPIGVFVNDAAITRAPLDKTKQDVMAVYCSIVGNIAQHKRAEEEMMVLTKFPSENPNPVLRVAKDGTLAYANNASFGLLKIWECEISQPLPDFWKTTVGDVLKSGISKEINVEVEDRIFSFMVASVPAIDCVYLYGKDVTEHEQAQAALEDERQSLVRRVEERTQDLSVANAELARATRLKDEFLASMSHELRTPMNSILGMSEVLLDEIYGTLNERQLKSVHSIDDSGRHLLSLINDILDLSKIEAGKLDLDMNPVAVESLCRSSMQFIKETAHKKHLKISTSYDSKVTTIMGDERRLKQILINMLSNAVKFTPDGKEIGLDIVGDAEGEVIHFTVWDTGIGLSADDLSKLFKPFVQLDSSLSRQHAGTGLGLSLISRLTELHGGGVSVDSEPGKGSRFTVSIPWKTVSEPAVNETSETKSEDSK